MSAHLPYFSSSQESCFCSSNIYSTGRLHRCVWPAWCVVW